MLSHRPAPFGTMRGGTGPDPGVVDEKQWLSGRFGIGTSDPIDAVGERPQRAKQASSMGFGREVAICELDVIMQILPGSSDNEMLINASTRFGNLAVNAPAARRSRRACSRAGPENSGRCRTRRA